MTPKWRDPNMVVNPIYSELAGKRLSTLAHVKKHLAKGRDRPLAFTWLRPSCLQCMSFRLHGIGTGSQKDLAAGTEYGFRWFLMPPKIENSSTSDRFFKFLLTNTKDNSITLACAWAFNLISKHGHLMGIYPVFRRVLRSVRSTVSQG